jgi:anti-sigma factor RsiW
MNCSEAEKRIYIYTELSALERSETDAHIQTCASCKEVLDRVDFVRALALSSSAPPLQNAGAMTRDILDAVNSQPGGKTLAFPRIALPGFANSLRYAMATLSLCLLAAFFAEYSKDSEVGREKLVNATPHEAIKLNTAEFSRALTVTKDEKSESITLYECVVNCLRRGDQICAVCAERFSKLNKANEKI